MVDAAMLVKTARERAQMSARDLAAESGVSPSTVTRIERGEINPTLAMLERLLDASGNDLEVLVTPRRQRPTLARLRSHRREITDAAGAFGGSNIRVFGSVARGESREDSDVDLLIDVAPGTGLVAIEQMTDAIESAIPWRVDVLTSGAARGRLAHVLTEAVAL